ncbi:hypothetical protein, partial [Chryseobacterium sp. Leaf394]|uniref:hypothetical protein n=1 Tax=Chryseobacterium sp. Leaf394 TaxID=1736361 RepID=UPI0019D6BDE8
VKTILLSDSKYSFISSKLVKDDKIVFEYEIQEFRNEKMINAFSNADVSFTKFKDDLSFVGLELLFDFYEISKKVSFDKKKVLSSGSISFDHNKS